MKTKTLMHSSILAAIFIAAVVGASMVNVFPGAKPFISVDQVSDKNVGDTFAINGTTNLPAGTELLFEVYPTSYETIKDQNGEFSGATGTITVSQGTGGMNTWTADVGLPASYFQPGELLVNVTRFTGNKSKGDFSTGSPFARTTFTVHPGSGNTDTSRHSDKAAAGGILIDPIPDTTAGKLLGVTGGTNLSVGTDLLVKVVPVITQNGKLTGDYQHPENVLMTKVIKGTGVNNRFSIYLDTRLLPVTDHIVAVSNIKGNTAGIDSEPGVFTCSQIFNILAGTTHTDDPNYNMSIPAVFINYIGDVTAGDPIMVTGTTNVPVGEKFQVSVIPADSMDFKHPEFSTAISAVRGSATANIFSVPVPTKDLTPGQYILFVSAEKYDVTGSILFTVK